MLTTPQKATLKAAILADQDWASFPNDTDGNYNLATLLSTDAAPNFWVWSTSADVQAIKDAVVWSALTPSDAPDGTQAWANRSLQCQGKQFNLQLILPMSGTMNATNANVRAGLQDALQGVRSGPAGASQDAGWAAVRNAMARKASNVEKVFADTALGNGSTRALCATMTWEGPISADDVQQARNS